MSLNTSLYTILLCLILDGTGNRLYAKYYNGHGTNPYNSLSKQLEFEKNLFGKINKVRQDIVLYDNNVITYKQSSDVLVIVGASLSENEAMLYLVTNNLTEALTILLDNNLDKSTIMSKYDMVSLCLDEMIDDGIVLEIDPAIVVSRVTNSPTHDEGLHIDIEGGLFNAFSFASKKLSERLQQGF